MRILKVLMLLLIFMSTLTQTVKAIQPIANTYKQGIYNISEDSESNYIAKLVTSNNVTTLIIIGSDGEQKFFKKFDTSNEPINLGRMFKGDTVIVIGTGEISATFVQ